MAPGFRPPGVRRNSTSARALILASDPCWASAESVCAPAAPNLIEARFGFVASPPKRVSRSRSEDNAQAI